MNDMLKYGLIGVGGYIILQKMKVIPGDLLASVTGEAALSPTTTTTTTNDILANVKAGSLSTTAGLLDAARKAASEPALMTVDQWNYYYQQARGTNGIDWAAITDPPKPRDYKLSLEEFLSYYGSGLAGLSGLGRGFDWDAHIRSGGARRYQTWKWRDF